MKTASTELIGTVRRFGKNGVLYEVLDEVNADTVRIRVIETGEETDYQKSRAVRDPME
jgi:hypothetical protein